MGTIVTNGDPEALRQNTVAGIDAVWRTSKFRGDKNLFMSVLTLKRQIDVMELVKLNVLHLHLSDNEGFRAERRLYPMSNRALCVWWITGDFPCPVRSRFSHFEREKAGIHCVNPAFFS